jgi:hypothetical protein
MIKSQDKTAVPGRHASCFAESDAALGIAFEKSDGTKRFAPSPFLCTVDFHGTNELVFRYTFGTITVRGHALEPLWSAVCRGNLAKVVEQAGERSAEDATTIRTIIVEDYEDYEGTSNVPRFPKESRQG